MNVLEVDKGQIFRPLNLQSQPNDDMEKGENEISNGFEKQKLSPHGRETFVQSFIDEKTKEMSQSITSKLDLIIDFIQGKVKLERCP